jgi:hypothetical protein
MRRLFFLVSLIIVLSSNAHCTGKKGVGLKAILQLPLIASTTTGLVSLALSAGSLSPSFSNSVLSYTVIASSSTTSTTVTPTSILSTDSISVNSANVASGSTSGSINLNTGSNTITIIVSASDGTSKTYKVTVIRVSTELSSLTVSSGILSPSFNAATTSYSFTVSNSASSISVTPTALDDTATISVNGSSVVSAATSSAISLSVGANTISIIVTSQGNTQTYTLNITRLNSNVYRVFVSSATHNGNFATGYSNGILGADAFCNSDSNKTDNVTFKAMMVDSGGNRRACSTQNCGGGVSENINWVLKPSSTYVRASDNQSIFSTNTSGIFVFGTLTNSFGTGLSYWTGFSSGGSNEWVASATNNCSNWGSSSSGGSARVGDGSSTSYTSLVNVGLTLTCNNLGRVVCVEQ